MPQNFDLTNFDPTPTHYFLKMLSNKGVVLNYLTQNIDNLEEKAGFNMNKVV
jgi:NAD-dependent SIR2 family protein deacetylase